MFIPMSCLIKKLFQLFDGGFIHHFFELLNDNLPADVKPAVSVAFI